MRARITAVMVGRISRLGLGNHPGLLLRPAYEGYCDYAFGGRAGPSVAVEHLFHEFAHAAEFGPEVFRQRASIYGFHFNTPKEWVFDRYCADPKTMQATERELRTFAYQYHLMRTAGYRLDAEAFAAESARAMAFMHDWYWVPGEGDTARKAYCVEQILAHIESTRSADALGRLAAWLDVTARRLERLKRVRPRDGKYLVQNAPRYKADGTEYVIH